jgi:glycine dehydrogenase
MRFVDRHIGPREADIAKMVQALGLRSLDGLVAQTVPEAIRTQAPLDLPPAASEHELLGELQTLADQNQLFRSYLGMGYAPCITPAVIQRNILENPGWYTAYTPYQAEVAQGRLEALLTFQTMTMDLTGLDVAGASLLDEATAAAEAMAMLHGLARDDQNIFFISENCHPQTIAVVRTRAEPRGITIVVGDHASFVFEARVFGALVQYPGTDGTACDYREFCERAHGSGARVVMACDLLSLALLVPPGELGADVALGNSQRLGVPMGYGGPHAAFFATRKEFTRRMPGRLIGVSQDVHGHIAYRMALQTREQHIRRDKATSNICTAQVLLAVIAGFYAVYHGPQGLRGIAERVAGLAARLGRGLRQRGLVLGSDAFFDTVRVGGSPMDVAAWLAGAEARHMNFRRLSSSSVTVTLDETTTEADVDEILAVFAEAPSTGKGTAEAAPGAGMDSTAIPEGLRRRSPYLTHPIFNSFHSETQMLRYIRSLEARDLSLTHSMIPLGSCTMKLNATVEMMPITWPRWSGLHPYAPARQAQGYQAVFRQLEAMLATITGLPAVSLQPNAGSQGEFAGLLVIRAYHKDRGQGHRNICLIPSSAHGTNPASAVMAGLEVVVVKCDERGNVDERDLADKAALHADRLAALMITYPSTHGVFEEGIKRLCDTIHRHGGQVYLDGANLNAQVGLVRPADVGADVCHVNLHKTFCIPHGGGGPGMGPICAAAHLRDYLPGHPSEDTDRRKHIGPVSAAPWGSASILLISWAYIRLMGRDGLTQATRVAILNANYLAKRLETHYPVVYRGAQGHVAHECILDLRPLKKTAGVEVDDVAKRLVDYGFHAPTMSFPIPGTLMIEPTESESLDEIDRFCEAMIAIRQEIAEIEKGAISQTDNPLKNAPHTAEAVTAEPWAHPYTRQRAAFPLPWVRQSKYWPPVGRLNNVFGDRNFMCACPPIAAFETPA